MQEATPYNLDEVDAVKKRFYPECGKDGKIVYHVL